MFDDDEEGNQTTLVNLITTQENILTQVLCFGTNKGIDATTQSAQKTDDVDSDEDQEIEVGDGVYVPKSLFTFKLLVFDTNTQNIVAPIMKVGKLRDCNILLHQNLQQNRERVPDLPVVYLIEPTSESFKRVA